MFTWIPIHQEAIARILEDKNQKELLETLRAMKEAGLKVIRLDDKGRGGKPVALSEIDPFTFFPTFNRGIKDEMRQDCWKFVKERWQLTSNVPSDFAGIPITNNLVCWFMPWDKDRDKDHVECLWQIASQAVEGGIAKVDSKLFDRCLKLRYVKMASLTIGLFWFNPHHFLPADSKTLAYAKSKGVQNKPVDYESYQRWVEEVRQVLGDNFPQISHEAHLFAQQQAGHEKENPALEEKPQQSSRDVEAPLLSERSAKEKAREGLFMAEADFEAMLLALKEKKNIILQGPPGVGKTFVARRLAYALTQSNDPQQIQMIQFHQSYSYEDFIQGYRPTPEGNFELKNGIFYEFCRRAQQEEASEQPYVFIIDEINRGNLSKIFGELMMLIECDKRGREYAIPLAYAQNAEEKFYLPSNLYLMGTMNTADRSLAMVDYALRRRFRFINLKPEFSSPAFKRHLLAAGVPSTLVEKIISRMNALNEAIANDTKNLGPGFQIGHSYFVPRDRLTPDESWYRRVVEFEILPLLEEYWFDQSAEVEKHRTSLLA